MSKTLKLADYLGKPFDCSCGRTHSTTLEGVTVSAGAMKALPEYVEKYGFKNLYIACDEITYGIAGEKVMNILKDAGIKAKAHVFKGKRFIPDEKALGELMIDADRDCDLVVAVGTGSINDMCRFFSFQMGVPYAIVATAAPMDGFASSGAALIINSMKTTIPAQTPLFIIGDTDILCGAPARMVSAGLGDLLGKFTCLNDWRISKVVNDEYYCDEIVNLVTDCIENVLADADNVASRDPKVIGDIMEGLVLTGVAMSFIGNSRPAAGCEHHMCHFWETLELQEGKIPVLHGTKVAVGTVMILKMTEFLRENRPDFDAAREKAKAYDQAAWEAKINEVYGASASSIIALEHESQKNVALMISGPFTIFNVLIDPKYVFKAMRKQPELMRDIFQKIERELLTYIKIAVEYGVDMISYADSSGGVNILGPKMAEQVVMDFTYDFLKKAIELLDGKAMLLLCPKTTLALIGTEKAGYVDHELPEVMRYGEACISLIGQVPVAGQMCIKNIDYQLENKKFREIRLY